MMIPPIIRLGPPPAETPHEAEAVVLHREFGWIVVQKAKADGYYKWKHVQDGLPVVSPVHFLNILCWMPQDGS